MVLLALWDPDPSVVAQRLGHKSQLRLMLATDRDAGRMNLRKTRIREERAFFESPIRGGHIAAAGIGGKIKNISVSAGSEDNGIGRVLLDLYGRQDAGTLSLGISVSDK